MDDATLERSQAQGQGQAQGRRPRRRWARGVDRPHYLQPGDLDSMMVMFVALMAEVSTLRDRLDTHEALADRGAAPATDAVESFSLDAERQAAREAARSAMLRRVLRAITEEREAALEHVKFGPSDVA
jgi:hypothetical protein